MSGSGGGGYGGGFNDDQDCCELVITTQISSPKEAVIKNIKMGSILDISLQAGGATETVVVLYDGLIAGGVAAPQVARLRECIKEGNMFVAEVLEITIAQVRIRIAAKE